MKIAITCEKNSVPIHYIKWIKQGGMEPVIVDRISRLKKFKNCDGIVFSGGGDIKYWFYSCFKIGFGNNALRDIFEYFAFNLIKDKPILAICRGAQIVNVFMGGTLKDLNNAHVHIGESDVFHPIFCGKTSFLINSRHHQAIDKIASGFKVLGVYGDVIEIAQNESIILCQYHPERLNDRIILQKFKDIIKKSKHTFK